MQSNGEKLFPTYDFRVVPYNALLDLYGRPASIMNSLISDRPDEKAAAVTNVFKGFSPSDFETRNILRESGLQLANWICQFFPEAVDYWRNNRSSNIKRALNTDEYDIYGPFLVEEPFYRSDPTFYGKARQVMFFPWEVTSTELTGIRAMGGQQLQEYFRQYRQHIKI